MNGVEFSAPKRLEKEYERAIRSVVGRVVAPKLPSESFDAWLRRLQDVSLDEQSHAISQIVAQRMIAWVNTVNARTWRQAASKTTKGSLLHRLLAEETRGAVGSRITRLVRENAQLISSIPSYAALHLSHEVLRAQQAGARPQTVARLIKARFPELIKSRVNLISRTEVAKASTALTRARCEELNVQFYIWRTSHDLRVRRSHRLMDGVVVPWGTAPAPEALAGERSTLGHYHAGECPNCRCTQIVVLTLDDLVFPATVYWQGRIVRMKRSDFQRIANLEQVA